MKRKRVFVGLGVIAFILVFFFSLLFLIGRRHGGSAGFGFGNRIALIEIKGVIAQSTEITAEINQYADDESVKAIILRVDSPGGGVGPSQEIYREVIKAKAKKKVVTSMGSVAASGGYYIASASDMIFANPGTITGSIGVIMQFSNFEELLKKIGVKGITIKSGENKDIGSPFRDMTPQEKMIMQTVLDKVHRQFIQAVAEGRKMDPAKVAQFADGRIFTGEQAKEYGLVDQMGNLEDTIDATAKLVGIQGKPTVIYPEHRITIWDYLLQGMARSVAKILSEKGFELSYRLLLPQE
jgi:protease IV